MNLHSLRGTSLITQLSRSPFGPLWSPFYRLDPTWPSLRRRSLPWHVLHPRDPTWHSLYTNDPIAPTLWSHHLKWPPLYLRGLPCIFTKPTLFMCPHRILPVLLGTTVTQWPSLHPCTRSWPSLCPVTLSEFDCTPPIDLVSSSLSFLTMHYITDLIKKNAEYSTILTGRSSYSKNIHQSQSYCNRKTVSE